MEDKLHLDLVNLEEELTKLKSSVEYIEAAKKNTEAASDIISKFVQLKIEFEEFAERAKLLLGKIDKIDFPSRLDKMDSTVASINQNIGNLQSRLESVERNLIDNIKSSYKSLIDDVENKHNYLLNRLTLGTKAIKLNRILIIICFIFVVTLEIIIYFK